MLRLLIDGKSVNLSADTGFDYNSSNPFFTKDGDYTLDIDINLTDPQNAIIYQSMDRLDISSRKKNRKAILYDENGILLSGSEIILEIDIHTAKIQLVAGNSELNYLSGGDSKIRKMDFGTIEITSMEDETNRLSQHYPATNWVSIPFISNTTGPVFQNKMTVNEVQGAFPSYDASLTIDNLYPQPYLAYYIDKIVNLLGYTLKENCITAEEKWCQLLLINGINTRDYAKMLPDWTADQFITEIEKLFNVIFVVNQANKTVSIISVKSFYTNRTKEYIKNSDIIDSNNKKYDQEETLYINYTNVKYDVPDYAFYKYADLDPELIKLCQVINQSGYDLDEQAALANYNKLVFFDFDLLKTKMIQTSKDAEHPGWNEFHLVQSFERIINDESSTSFVELKIIPSEMYGLNFGIYQGSIILNSIAILPVCHNNSDPEETDDEGLNQYIVEGIPEEATPDKIFVAFYDGIIGTVSYPYDVDGVVYNTRSGYLYPECHTRWVEQRDKKSRILDQIFDENKTLELHGDYGMYKQYYETESVIDTTTEYIIQFRNYRRTSPMSIYNISNKLFYCKNLKYTVKNNSISEIVEGTFYLMN